MIRRFAQVDSDGLVSQVIVAESAEWCVDNLGGEWVETFKDRSARYHYASAGFFYDAGKDAFIPPKPYDSWVLDSNCEWQAPVPKPEGDYTWKEETQTWEVVEIG